MTLKTLNKSDIRKLNDVLLEKYGREFLNKKDFVQLAFQPFKHIKINKEFAFFYFEDEPVPFLKLLIKNLFLKKIFVDKGAIKHVCNGADVMRPGIVKVDESIKKGEIVVIVDEAYEKPLVVGKALYDGEEIINKKEGKVVKNLHFVSDDKWGL